MPPASQHGGSPAAKKTSAELGLSIAQRPPPDIISGTRNTGDGAPTVELYDGTRNAPPASDVDGTTSCIRRGGHGIGAPADPDALAPPWLRDLSTASSRGCRASEWPA